MTAEGGADRERARKGRQGGTGAAPGDRGRDGAREPGAGGGRRRGLRDALFLARRDLSRTLRQGETLLWVFVMPIVFFYFIGTVTGGAGGTGAAEDAPDPLVLRAPADAGFLAEEIRRGLEEQGYRVLPPDSVPAGKEAARELVIPPPGPDSTTFTDAVLEGRARTVTLRREGDGGLSAEFDQVRAARAVYGVVADLAVLKADSVAADPAQFRRLDALPRPLTLEVRTAGRRKRIPSGFSQAVPGTMVMFTMLVLLTAGAVTLVVEREKGVLKRLAATPISRSSVVLGKWAALVALGLVQIGFAVAAGTLLFGLDWGSAPGALGLVLVAWAAFNASLSLLLAGLARTEAQASGVGVLATLLLAALGGAWWPIEITPPWMQSLALTLPTGWAMDAMHRLVNFGYGLPSVAWHLAALAGGTLVVTWLAVRRFRYQ